MDEDDPWDWINAADAKLLVDHDLCQISLHFLHDIPNEKVKDYLLAAHKEVRSGFQYDWLVDFLALTTAMSEAEYVELGRLWQRMARGRDVGRRTAFVTCEPVMRDRLTQSQSVSSYRTIGVFESVAEAQEWLGKIAPSRSGSGIQLI